VQALAEERYYEAEHGLYIDSFPEDFSVARPYRGQNANMHMCEAQIALFEALGEVAYLERATVLAKKLVMDLPRAAGCDGFICEHYTSMWQPDPTKNKDADPGSEEYIFRPFGFQPGHSFEWCKLLLLLERHHAEQGTNQAERAWMLPAAELIFKTACKHGWDHGNGGVYYTVDGAGHVLDRNKYYWALAEMIAAAGLLGARTGGAEYWEWYDQAWIYAQQYFIDSARGGWYPMVNAGNMRTDPYAGVDHSGEPIKCYPSKTDYHPLAACYEVLRAMQ